MSESNLVWRVVDWDQRYETRGTLQKSAPRLAIPISTDLCQMSIQRLLDLEGGLQVLGIWHILWMLAARSPRRGVLAERGMPTTVFQLAQTIRCSTEEMEQALAILCRPDIGLLEQVPLEEALLPPVIPPAPPRKPRKRASLLFSHCPACHADLVAIAEKMTTCDHGHHAEDCDCHTTPQPSEHVHTHHIQPNPTPSTFSQPAIQTTSQPSPVSSTPIPPGQHHFNRLPPGRKKRKAQHLAKLRAGG